MPVDIHTKLVTLLGMPLSQSFAARMQNAAYRAMGLNMLYFYTEVEQGRLPDVVNALRYMPFAGFAVTKPYKIEVLKYLDALDPLCEKTGASNTVVIHDGRLIGYNTDGDGFLTSLLEETDVSLPDTVCFCMGAGGAGRAICCALASRGAKRIFICDANEAAAKQLVCDINTGFAPAAELAAFADETGKADMIRASKLLINATGLGMAGSADQTPYPKALLSPGQICFDATYHPSKTRFLAEAEGAGCTIMNGLGMSLHQGAAQIKLWSGQDAPVDVMRNELNAILAEQR